MQVSCSNCGARYAVDATAIGPAGRTVQCVRCNHRWFQKLDPPAVPPPGPAPRAATVPDFVIRPTGQNANLPALSPPPRRSPWGTWLAVVIGLIVLLGALGYAYRIEVRDRLPPDWRLILNVDTLRALFASPAKAARNPVLERPRLDIDVAASRIDLVDGRYVVAGELVNLGTAPGSTRALKLVFRAGEQVVGERILPLVEGPIAPGGRASFSLALDDPPAGTTNIVPTLD